MVVVVIALPMMLFLVVLRTFVATMTMTLMASIRDDVFSYVCADGDNILEMLVMRVLMMKTMMMAVTTSLMSFDVIDRKMNTGSSMMN